MPGNAISRKPEPACRSRDSGFSLIELIAGISLLTVGMAGLMSVLVLGERSHDRSDELSTATRALGAVSEQIRAAPFADAYARYQGQTFAVNGIDDSVATIQIYVDETDTSADALALGFPRDLDGDGNATNPNVSTTFQLLAVKIEVTWPTTRGTDQRALYFLLSQDD